MNITESSKWLLEKQAQLQKEDEERIAKEKAEWDSLPEEEKIRITKQREQERKEKEKIQAEKEKEEQIKKWKKQGITPRFFDATWDNYIADTPEKQKAKDKMKIAWIKNLFVTGNNGTGKTHLAMCLVKDGAIFCVAAELFRTVRENQRIEQKIINEMGTCKLLIIDETGRQKGTDFEQNLLFEIIDKRWNNMLPTTIIGNIGEREFADLYGQAILDRLRPETVEFNWESKRQN